MSFYEFEDTSYLMDEARYGNALDDNRLYGSSYDSENDENQTGPVSVYSGTSPFVSSPASTPASTPASASTPAYAPAYAPASAPTYTPAAAPAYAPTYAPTSTSAYAPAYAPAYSPTSTTVSAPKSTQKIDMLLPTSLTSESRDIINTAQQKLDNLYKIRMDDQKFMEEQSKNMLSLVDIINTYQEENVSLKNKMNEKDQICKLQLDVANSGLLNDADTSYLKNYIKIEIFLLVLLFILIIFYFLM